MIHSQTIKDLTEDELGLLWSLAEHFFNKFGLNCKYQWLQMVRIPVLEQALHNCNLKEEYHTVRDSLLSKLKEGWY